MKSDTLIYGEELLSILDEFGREVEFPELEQKSNIKGEELKELLKYLVKKDYLRYSLGLFIATENTFSKLGESNVKLLPKGMEVVLGQRDYFNEMGISQTIHNQTNVNNSSEFQIAQTSGDKSPITQTQDNSKINILRQLIENDGELEESKKKELFGILEKFNTINESGENAFNLMKKVGSIAARYVPLFFNLFK